MNDEHEEYEDMDQPGNIFRAVVVCLAVWCVLIGVGVWVWQTWWCDTCK